MPDDAAHESGELAAAVSAIRADREHGASWLARAAARALADATANRATANRATATDAWLRTLRGEMRALARARPSMAALPNTVARIWQAGATASDDAARVAAIHAEAVRLLAAWEEAAARIAAFAAPLLGETVYTHSRSGTLEQALPAAGVRRVVIGESRPGGEGVAAARAFAAAGLDVTLAPDGASATLLPAVHAVAIGADSVRADGSVVNKVGSCPLAITAHALGIPVYALCETMKIAPPDFPLTLEEMPPDELLAAPVERVAVRNLYFDRTPAEYITAVITEIGVLDRAAIATRATEAASAWAALLG